MIMRLLLKVNMEGAISILEYGNMRWEPLLTGFQKPEE
jgi:hypothetical protein